MSDTTQKTETLGFQTEAKQLLHLMTHSLYSNREIFLRELVSNASDACDKLRFEALDNADLLADDTALKIRISVDSDNNRLHIIDNGIGMNRDEIIANLGTIASSGTAKFMSSLSGDQRKDSNLIGQFGVGFYSGFIVADKVEVFSRRAGNTAEEAVYWSCTGEADYEVGQVTRQQRGTEVVLHLKEDAKEFNNDWRLKSIIKKYSDHIGIPIEMPKADTGSEEGIDKDKDSSAAPEWETVNSATALWTRPSKNIKKEEYIEFYKHVSHDWNEPLTQSHNRVEGKMEYISLLYVPRKPTFDLYQREAAKGLKLYIQRTFIMDDAEQFLPMYLRFIKGVLDANDLPMNISRELLQQSKQVDSLRTALTKRVLDMLKKMASNKPEDYQVFWDAFGKVLKEGSAEDTDNQEKIAKLLRFSTTHDDKPGQTHSLDDYIGRMQADQNVLYYVHADSHTKAQKSPHIESLRQKGIEVILLSDPIDEWLMGYLTEYDGKSFSDVRRSSFSNDEAEKKETDDQTDNSLIDRISKVLADRVQSVRSSHGRLIDSSACLVMDDGDMGATMRRMMEAAGQSMPESKPIFEVNLDHAILKRMDKEADEDRFNDWVEVIFDQASLATGEQLNDPVSYVERINKLLVDIA